MPLTVIGFDEMSQRRELTLFLYRKGRDFQLPDSFNFRYVPLFTHNYASAGPPELLVREGVRLVDEPDEADFLLFPYYLDPLLDRGGYHQALRFVTKLAHYRRRPRRHVVFVDHDLDIRLNLPVVSFRASLDERRRDHGAHTIPLLVDDWAKFSHFDLDKVRFDVSFCGYAGSSEVRFGLLKSLIETRGNLRCLIRVFAKFHWHVPREDRLESRQQYIDSLRDSLLVLCPGGTGHNSLRFFETMSMGRIPVLVSDHCALPFEEAIDYDSFLLRIDEAQASQAGRIINDWLAAQSRQQLLEKARKARSVWEMYFSRAGCALQIAEILARRASDAGSLEQPVDDDVESRILPELRAATQHALRVRNVYTAQQLYGFLGVAHGDAAMRDQFRAARVQLKQGADETSRGRAEALQRLLVAHGL